MAMVIIAMTHVAIAAELEFRNPDSFRALNLPFSEAVRVGDLLFLSGQLGNKPGSVTLVEGGVQAEIRQTMENIGAVLKRNGLGFDRVAKCTLFIADIEDWPAVNTVYATYFGSNPPARSALAASGLALGARVEVECVAAF